RRPARPVRPVVGSRCRRQGRAGELHTHRRCDRPAAEPGAVPVRRSRGAGCGAFGRHAHRAGRPAGGLPDPTLGRGGTRPYPGERLPGYRPAALSLLVAAVVGVPPPWGAGTCGTPDGGQALPGASPDTGNRLAPLRRAPPIRQTGPDELPAIIARHTYPLPPDAATAARSGLRLLQRVAGRGHDLPLPAIERPHLYLVGAGA